MNQEEKGMLIHKMQLDFNNAGYRDAEGYRLKTDGIYGNKTKSVYEQYKKDNKEDYDDYNDFKAKDGNAQELSERYILRDDNGNPIYLASVNTDLTGVVADKPTKNLDDLYYKPQKTKLDINLLKNSGENEELVKEQNDFREKFADFMIDVAKNQNIYQKITNPLGYYVSKQAQRLFWKTGADLFLEDYSKCYTSAWMLKHSLQDKPDKVVRGNNSAIAYKINNSKEYLEALDEAIANSKNGIIDQKLENKAFSDKDLYFSLNNATIYVKGYKDDDGYWNIAATLTDTYDFTEILFLEKGMSGQKVVGSVANNLALMSQLADAITPYEVEVNFYTRRKV